MLDFLTVTVPVVQPTLFIKIIAVVGVAGASYILGSICFAIIFTYLFTKKDIRQLGSGNAGTSNVFRSAGFLPGALTGLFDFLKGVLAVYIGYWLFEWAGFEAYTGGCFAALFVLIGHLYPIFFNYRGGKGVMTVAGIMLVLNVKVLAALLVIYLIVLAITRITSVAGLVGITLLPVANAIFQIIEGKDWVPTTIYFALIAALIWYSHRENIKRLKEGRENKAYVHKEEPKPDEKK